MSRSFWRSVRDGFDSLTLGPSPQLERLREDAEQRLREAREERERVTRWALSPLTRDEPIEDTTATAACTSCGRLACTS